MIYDAKASYPNYPLLFTYMASFANRHVAAITDTEKALFMRAWDLETRKYNNK